MAALDKPAYAVLNEHTLGYVTDAQPNWFGVLASKPQRGGYDPKNGPVSIANGAGLRPATLADFEFYRVCPKGHIA